MPFPPWLLQLVYSDMYPEEHRLCLNTTFPYLYICVFTRACVMGNDTEYVWRSEVDFQDLVPLLPPWLPGVELRSSGSGVRPLQSGGGGGVSRDNTIQFPLKN